ncbi:MAG: response regulator [Polyangiaceae bacterium]|nr:response regulator [Polyangiaceae bacterium]
MNAGSPPTPGMAASIAALIAFIRTSFRGPESQELRDEQRKVILQRTVVLIWISVFVMPSTIWSYVYFLAPDALPKAVWIVLAAIAAVFVHRELVSRGVFDRIPHVAMLLLVGGVFGPTGSAIVEVTRGSQGDFFFAFFMIYFAFTSLFPADAKWIVLTSGAIIASYIGARTFRPEGLVFDATLTSSLIYLLELTFIGVVLNRVLCKLFFDEKRARVELARANDGLRELDKAKSQFFSNISHEIRTPLTLIITPISQLLQRGQLSPEVAKKLEAVRANANRLLRMVNSLLDFAKVEAGQAGLTMSRVNLDDFVKATSSLFTSAAEAREISLSVDAAAESLTVRTDLDKIEKILVNLTGNAMKFTPNGGKITIRVAKKGSDSYELSVSDTGIGIAPQDQQKIFQRFTQIEGSQKTSVKGTGIGLAMVQEYAKLLGGQVQVESELGAGSTFRVTLPVQPPALPASARATPTPSPPPAAVREVSALVDESELAVADLVREQGPARNSLERAGEGRPRVLVVDDNPALVNLVSSILEESYDLYLASSGEEALERLASNPVDLVVSDVMMPGISGLELCKRIKTDPRTRLVPVILLTARGGVSAKVEGLEHGADDYIGKPFDPEELLARVRSLFELRGVTKSLEVRTNELSDALAKLHEEELKVIEAEKLRTVGELAAGIFHELHNALNMIKNGATPLKEAIADMKAAGADKLPGDVEAGDLMELADVVLDASNSAVSVTSELKRFAFQDTSKPQIVDLHGVVKSTLRLFGKPSKDLKVEVELAPEAIAVECISTRLSQVFTNLVKNAIEAMNGKGTLRITSRIEGGSALVTVSDTGPGIDAKARAKLFEPFFTTKKQGEGLGLGLSLARKVMHDAGGDLRLDDTNEKGARFVVTMPLASRGQATEGQAAGSESVKVQPPPS